MRLKQKKNVIKEISQSHSHNGSGSGAALFPRSVSTSLPRSASQVGCRLGGGAADESRETVGPSLSHKGQLFKQLEIHPGLFQGRSGPLEWVLQAPP